MISRFRRTIHGTILPLPVIAACALWACTPRYDETAKGTDVLTIGAYSVVREVFQAGLLPAFASQWQAQTGRKVRFEESYTASGAQSRAIASGFDADIAVLSLEPDVERLVKAKLVNEDWNTGPTKGIISHSLVVIAVRPGNPKGITDWQDLAKPNVGVLYPDPKTSGGARWNINAIYGAGLLKDRGPGGPLNYEAGRDLLERVQQRVITMDASGRQSIATFERGTGDAAVTYENELLIRQKLKGDVMSYVVPPATLLIESPAVIVESSVKQHGNRAFAEAFLAFMRSEEGQRLFVVFGFRSLATVTPAIHASLEDRQKLPARLFTIQDLGGWNQIIRNVYDAGGIWDSLFTPKMARGN